MSSLLPGFEYDIFISYRQKDNKGAQWVTKFVAALKTELEATFKEDISVYFDENPHDGLLDTHQVDKSLEGKLNCLIFIPIISHTYCDPKSFAWSQEFLPFCHRAKKDPIGLDIQLQNKNVTSRILPIQIHEIDETDKQLFEQESGGQLRPIEFIFKSSGVNRPLTAEDLRSDNANRTFYRDQINKTANAIEEIFKSIKSTDQTELNTKPVDETSKTSKMKSMWTELQRRNVFRAGLTYLIVAFLIHQLIVILTPTFKIEERIINIELIVLAIGFPIAMAFAWFYEVSPDGLIRTTSQQSILNPYPASRKKPMTGGLIVTVLISLLIVQYVYFNYSKKDTLINSPLKSIAVLPFENRSGNREDDYIADGLTDDIINNLSVISQLKVTNRRNIQQYHGEIASFDRIAEELQVMAIVIGSIQRLGNKVVIRAQMIDAPSNSFIWGNTLYRSTDDIMTVQFEIAKVIAEKLEIKLNELELLRLEQKPTKSATAYDYYLKGRSLYYKYDPVANDSAIIQFKKAIAQDSSYANAWAGLGDAFAQKHGRFAREYEWTDSSLLAGKRAIQLDSNLSDGYKALATAYNYREAYEKAFPLLLKAVELNPTNDQAIGNLGTNYLLRGDLPEALRWEKKAAGMSPKNWIPYQLTGWIYRLLGDLENAESWLLKSLELNPMVYDTYELLGYTYVAQRRTQEALDLIPQLLEIDRNETRVLETAGLIAHYAGDSKNAKKYFQQSIEKNPNYKADRNSVSPIGYGQILLQEGKNIEAEVYLTHALENNLVEIENGSKSFDPRFYIAAIYAIKGNKEQSLIWLQKAIDMNWIDYIKFEHGPYFTNYKTDPDFLNLISQIRTKTKTMLARAKAY